jgi:hypothetical protein
MHVLPSLWLPIILSAVFVFIVSAFIHMALPWHKGDSRKVPHEDQFRDAVRPLAVPPGDYMVPTCDSMQEMRSPGFKEKHQQGPVMMMTVFPNGQMGMGRALGLWFLYLVVVSAFAAYVARHALPPGASYRHVFRFAGVTAFLAYAGALWQMSIWYRRSWGTTLRSTIDGLIYAGVTAGVFGWLWPR